MANILHFYQTMRVYEEFTVQAIHYKIYIGTLEYIHVHIVSPHSVLLFGQIANSALLLNPVFYTVTVLKYYAKHIFLCILLNHIIQNTRKSKFLVENSQTKVQWNNTCTRHTVQRHFPLFPTVVLIVQCCMYQYIRHSLHNKIIKVTSIKHKLLLNI